MFNNFFDAFHYLKSHEMFQGMFESCLDIEVVKVNPLTKCIEDDENLNTEVNVWLECGKYSKNIRWHDINLDCGTDTFENAIIELAKLVKEYYGDEYIWNDDDEPKF